MKYISFLMAIFFVIFSAKAESNKWAFDAAHSSVSFNVNHMVISEVSGQFKKFDGEVLSNKKDFSDAKINFSIDVNSIDTDNEKRDNHLKSPDFFNAKKYAKMTFVSKSFKKINNKNYKLTGDFTLHGVTKTITLDVFLGGVITDPYKNTRAGFKISGKLNRKDFGLKWNMAMEAGGLVVGNEVRITCRVELVKVK